MSLIGLDLNATRLRAVTGPAGIPPHALTLDGSERELPLSISLANRYAEVGRPGRSNCRREPYNVCDQFLDKLGTNQEWSAGKHRLDATKAMGLVFDHLKSSCSSAKGLVLALPPYLAREQAELLPALATKSKLPLLGSVPATLALVLNAFKSTPWTGPAIVVDVDDSALTCSIISSGGEDGMAALEESGPAPTLTLLHSVTVTLDRLGMRAWKERLIDVLADRCIRHSRWDLRDSADAEQMLYDQLDDVLDAWRQGQMVEVIVQAAQWCQNLILRPEEIHGFCAPLVRQAGERVREAFTAVEAHGLQRVLVTEAASRLPGLSELLKDEAGEAVPLVSLPADAAAQGAHDLAGHFQRGELPRDYLDAIVRCPLYAPQPAKQPEKKKKRMFRF